MTQQDKINYILIKLNEDTPASNTGKILKMVLISTIPSLGIDKLDQLVTLLGGDIHEEDIT